MSSAGLHLEAALRRVSTGLGRRLPALSLRGGIWVPPLVFLFAFAGCRSQQPPTAPERYGPDFGQPGETLAYQAVSRDANGGNLSYLFNWGDGSTPAWSAELGAGDTLTERHVFVDTGRFAVTVKARDETRRESDWAEPLTVVSGFAGPETPARPTGGTSGYPDTMLLFSTAANHVRGESVSVQFDWGDTLGSWAGFVAAGATASDSHTYRSTGEYEVRARARDRAGNTSPWSASDTVVIGMPPLDPPRNLRLSSASGVYVRLNWSPGRNNDSVRYQVWFRPLGLVEFVAANSGTGTQIVHDPFNLTGEYTLSARYGGEEVFGPDTLSTVPVATDTIVLGELNTDMAAGYGWDSISHTGRSGSMHDTLDAPLLDWYFTDLTPGYLGPSYYMATASFGPQDPGGSVPPGPWRNAGLLGILGSAQDPLPEYDSLYYQQVVDVSSFTAHVAVHTQEGYYALVTTLGPNMNNGTIPALSWFQTVRGLRLIRHPDGVKP